MVLEFPNDDNRDYIRRYEAYNTCTKTHLKYKYTSSTLVCIIPIMPLGVSYRDKW